MADWQRELEELVAQHLAWLRVQIAREARNLGELTDHLVCRLAETVEPLPVETMLRACREARTDWFALYHGRSKPLSSVSIRD